MGVYKQSVSFSEAAIAFARELVENGEYPNISAAVSGEMTRASALREMRNYTCMLLSHSHQVFVNQKRIKLKSFPSSRVNYVL